MAAALGTMVDLTAEAGIERALSNTLLWAVSKFVITHFVSLYHKTALVALPGAARVCAVGDT